MSLARTLRCNINDCTIPSVYVPLSTTQHYSGFRGILLNLETVDLLRSSGYTWNDITSSLQVSRTTLWRCLTEANYEIKRFTDISDDEVDSILRDCRGITPIVDSRVLKQRDVIVQCRRLRENTARTDLIHGHLFIYYFTALWRSVELLVLQPVLRQRGYS